MTSPAMSADTRRPAGRLHDVARRCVHDRRLRAPQLVAVVEVLRAAGRHDEPHQIGPCRCGGPGATWPSAARCPSRRRRAGPVCRAPRRPSTDRAAHLELVARQEVLVQIRRHLTVVQPLHRQLDLRRAVGRGGHRVPTATRCSHQARSGARRTMLARHVGRRLREGEAMATSSVETPCSRFNRLPESTNSCMQCLSNGSS